MGNKKRSGLYSLEERTFQFAKAIRKYTKSLPRSTENFEDSKQLVRASGSVGANYIEANESFSKKDFLYRIKICRKEAKESAFFLRLIYETNTQAHAFQGVELQKEAIELKKIFSAIIQNSRKP